MVQPSVSRAAQGCQHLPLYLEMREAPSCIRAQGCFSCFIPSTTNPKGILSSTTSRIITASGGRGDLAFLAPLSLTPRSPVFHLGIHRGLSNLFSLKPGVLYKKASFPTSADLVLTLKSEIYLWSCSIALCTC